MSLADRLLKAGAKGNSASMLKKSRFFNDDIGIPTSVYSLNIALSGSIHGGILPGVGVIAGPSKHFKSNLSLEIVSSYMKKHKESICIFYDSEFGTKKGYFEKSGVDEDRVIHVPISDIEELTFDVAQKLKEIEESDKVIILIDSVGNLASKKEVADAEGENSAMDMTRAKKLKGFFRIVTPKLHMKFIPMICIAHVYQTQETYSKTIISGGTGIQYSSDWSLIVGRRQVKDEKTKEMLGYDFILNSDKSRFIKEKSALVYAATYAEGVDPYGGLLDVALLTGHVIKPKQGWYSRPAVEEDKNWRRKESSCHEFWKPIIDDPSFDKAVGELYLLSAGGSKTVDSALLEAIGKGVDPHTGELVE
jgi:RecA/RadA recombinase